MRIFVLLVASVLLGALPYVAGRQVLGWRGPRACASLAAISLIGMSMSVVILLVALLDPAGLSIRALPSVVDRCVDAAERIFAHPIRHWPHILGAVLLVFLIARIAFALATTLRDSRRSMPSRGFRAARAAWVDPSLVLIDHDTPLAFVTGVLRGRVVVSSGLLRDLEPDELQAVLAHEQAHVQGRHTGILFMGRVISHAFGFLPPVRRAVGDLILGLEAAADDAAAVRVGSPLVVARALARMAELATARMSVASLGVAESEVLVRVRRLTVKSGERSRGTRSLRGAATVAFAAALLAGQLLLLPATARAASASVQARELHLICHLPHTP